MEETIEKKEDRLPPMPETILHNFVKNFFERRQYYLDAVQNFGSPLYILEPSVLRDRAEQFRSAFENNLPETSFYYAMKSNNLPDISRILIKEGFGIDVSSGQELEWALRLNAKDIIFSGPGKTDGELKLAADNHDKTTLLLDSAGELKRLKEIMSGREETIRVGIRLKNNPQGLWRKFGIMPEDLSDVYHDIQKHPKIDFKGLQFHSSWNLSPVRQIDFLNQLGEILKKMPKKFLNSLEFLDIGGGYWPSQGEWLLSDKPLQACRIPSEPIEKFAEQIAEAVKEKIFPLADCRICFEPGRWLCNDAMHILIRVIDKKAQDLVITDAGTNTIGWERFETDYFPVLNISRSGLIERPCNILGSLCTPHDVWGYAYFGQDIQEGDILMIPTQGAYTYSLRQNFIKPLPRVVNMEDQTCLDI